MKLLAIAIRDFLSIEQLVIDLEERRGLVLVTGPNGSGKTAIIAESVHWALFGKTLRGLTLSEVVRAGCRQAEVRITMELGGLPIRVVRRAAISGQRNLAPLEVSGLDSAVKKTDLEAQLREMLPFTDTMFRSIFMLAEGFEESFARSSKRERAELIERLTGCEALDAAHKRVKDGRQVLLGKLATARERIANAERMRARLGSVGHEADVRRAEKLSEATDRVARIEGKLRDHRAAGVPEPAETNQRQVLDLMRGEHARWVAAERHLLSERNRIESLTEEARCPTCRQPIGAEHVRDTMLSIQVELESVAGHKVAAAQKLADAQKVVDEFEAKQKAHQRWNEDDRRIWTELTGAKQTLSTLQASASEERGAADRQRSEIDAEIAAAVKDHETQNDKLPYIEFWLKAFSVEGIRSFRLDGVLDWLNTRLRVYSEALFDGVVLSLSPEKQGKTKATNEISIVCDGLKGRRYEGASRGQRRRIDLAIHLALQDLAWQTSRIRCNVMVADEVLDSLDADAATRAIALFEERAKQVGTVFLVSHEDRAVKSKIGRVWRVSAPDGVTVLEE